MARPILDPTAEGVQEGPQMLFVVADCTHTIGFQDCSLLRLGQTGGLIDLLGLPLLFNCGG